MIIPVSATIPLPCGDDMLGSRRAEAITPMGYENADESNESKTIWNIYIAITQTPFKNLQRQGLSFHFELLFRVKVALQLRIGIGQLTKFLTETATCWSWMESILRIPNLHMHIEREKEVSTIVC